MAQLDSSHPSSLARETTIVPFRSVGAVIAPSGYGSVDLTDEELAEYSRVLQEVHSHAVVLPAPPGTVFRSRDNLERWLELHYFTFTQTLSALEGHTEARVTITKTKGVDPDRATEDESREKSRQLMPVAVESMRVLRGQAAATVTIPPPEHDTSVVAQASFLVESGRWGVFTDLVEKEDQRHEDLDFSVSGPWPPYDFVKMEFGA